MVRWLDEDRVPIRGPTRPFWLESGTWYDGDKTDGHDSSGQSIIGDRRRWASKITTDDA